LAAEKKRKKGQLAGRSSEGKWEIESISRVRGDTDERGGVGV